MFNHEKAYRREVFEKLEGAHIVIGGAGALGSNLAYHLVKQGARKIKVIDKDRVELHNVPTQIWSTRDVGVLKTRALQNIIHRDTGVLIEAVPKELTPANAKALVKDAQLIVDVFDNWKARHGVGEAGRVLNTPCVHAGMSDNGFAEIKWDAVYHYGAAAEREDAPGPCDVALSRNLVILTVAVLSEVVVRFVGSGQKVNREVTLQDIRIWDVSN